MRGFKAWILRNIVFRKKLITINLSHNPYGVFDVVKIGSSGELFIYLGNNKIIPQKYLL